MEAPDSAYTPEETPGRGMETKEKTKNKQTNKPGYPVGVGMGRELAQLTDHRSVWLGYPAHGILCDISLQYLLI